MHLYLACAGDEPELISLSLCQFGTPLRHGFSLKRMLVAIGLKMDIINQKRFKVEGTQFLLVDWIKNSSESVVF